MLGFCIKLQDRLEKYTKPIVVKYNHTPPKSIPMQKSLEALFPGRVVVPRGLSDIPGNAYMVYVLSVDGKPIVVGHGRKNRASILFDDLHSITKGHIKALFVRLYHLYGSGRFERYIIRCAGKTEAADAEKIVHQHIGGNHREIPAPIRAKLFEGLPEESVARLLLEIAIRSSYDGLSDLRKWRSDGLLNDAVWRELSGKLKL